MNNNNNENRALRAGLALIAAFAVWTLLIMTVDVKALGPCGSTAGFATLNGWFHRLTGVHMMLYTLTDWLGLVPAFVCIFFAGLGLVQWIRRRSLTAVDSDILLLGAYYAVVILAYLIFEMVPVNYRPVLIEGRLEASYPSSTTLLVLSVMPTLIFQAKRRLESAAARKAVCTAAGIFSAFMVTCRLISGVHWFTDIVGAALLSAGLFYTYKGAVSKCCRLGGLLWNLTKNFRSSENQKD